MVLKRCLHTMIWFLALFSIRGNPVELALDLRNDSRGAYSARCLLEGSGWKIAVFPSWSATAQQSGAGPRVRCAVSSSRAWIGPFRNGSLMQIMADPLAGTRLTGKGAAEFAEPDLSREPAASLAAGCSYEGECGGWNAVYLQREKYSSLGGALSGIWHDGDSVLALTPFVLVVTPGSGAVDDLWGAAPWNDEPSVHHVGLLCFAGRGDNAPAMGVVLNKGYYSKWRGMLFAGGAWERPRWSGRAGGFVQSPDYIPLPGTPLRGIGGSLELRMTAASFLSFGVEAVTVNPFREYGAALAGTHDFSAVLEVAREDLNVTLRFAAAWESRYPEIVRTDSNLNLEIGYAAERWDCGIAGGFQRLPRRDIDPILKTDGGIVLPCGAACRLKLQFTAKGAKGDKRVYGKWEGESTLRIPLERNAGAGSLLLAIAYDDGFFGRISLASRAHSPSSSFAVSK